MAAPEANNDQGAPEEIPEKNYYKIGEVSVITGLEPYVLRYWETEFKQIKPVRAQSKQRLYRREDLDTILRIKKLLYEEKFTIAGAKRRLLQDDDDTEAAEAGTGPTGDIPRDLLEEIKSELMAIKDMLA